MTITKEEFENIISEVWLSDDIHTIFDSFDSTCLTFIDGSMIQYWLTGKIAIHSADQNAKLVWLCVA